MWRKFTFTIRQWLKLILQRMVLPIVYWFYRRQEVNQNIVVFADSHHDEIPYSMQLLYKAMLAQTNFTVIDFFYDFSKQGVFSLFKKILYFMKLYANARYVVICDYFLPVSSCKKREETTVIQLWHSGGLLKKFAYDSLEDLPRGTPQNIFANYDMVTVSAPICIPVLASAMRLPENRFILTGISRTDCYYDQEYIGFCKEQLYQLYPQANGKKVILWAPTFRGNAGNPQLCGLNEVQVLQEALPGNYLLLIKVHPHLDVKEQISNCTLPTEQLLPVTDLLITDYSSILFDYILLERPFILFAPDFDRYIQRRGLYIEYDSLPGKIAKNGDELFNAIIQAFSQIDGIKLKQCKHLHMGACDGNATDRIMTYITGKASQSMIVESVEAVR